MVKTGYIKAGSVGFLPIEYSLAKDRDRPLGIDFHQQELLEFSIVPVPANQNALAQAGAKGLIGYRDPKLFDHSFERADRVRTVAALRVAPDDDIADTVPADPEPRAARERARATAAVVIQGYGRH